MAPPSTSAGAGAAAVAPLMSSDEVNLLVYAYLAESTLEHSAFTLYNESKLDSFVSSSTFGDGSHQRSATSNGEPASATATSSELHPAIPPTGHLIRILQKGLLYLQAEAKYRGEDVAANPPRLIGYAIPDTLPLPALPKTLPPPSPPLSVAPSTTSTAAVGGLAAATTNGKRKQQAGALSNGTASGSGQPKSATAGPSGLKRKDKDGAAAALSDAAAASAQGPSGSKANDEQDQAATSSSATALHPTKKQRTGKSPALAEALATAEGSNGAASAAVEDKTAVEAISTSSKNKKGKGRAVDAQGDSEMGDAASSTIPLNAKGPLARAIASATAAKPISPSAGSNGKDTFLRRSTSPVVTTSRRNSGQQTATATKDGSAAKRPRSTSPSTALRSASSTTTSRKEASNPTASTPTLDTSKMLGTNGKPDSSTSTSSSTTNPPTASRSTGPATSLSAKPEPKNILKSDAVISLKGHTMSVQPCHWNDKVENLLATGSGDSTMRIWDVPAQTSAKGKKAGTETVVEPSYTCKHASGQRRSDVTAVAWNAEGSLLATGSEDGIARIWTPSGDLHLVLSMHQRTIFTLRWNSSGTMLLTGSLDHSVCMWDTGYGKVKQQWTSHSDSILDLDWMTDDVFASCSMDKNINIHQHGRASAAYRFKGHSDEVNCIRFDPTRRLLASCSDDNTVRIWSLKAVKSIVGIKDDAVKAEATEDGEIAGPSSTGADDDDEPTFLVLRGHKKEVHAVAWCPKRELGEGGIRLLASASFDSTARLWDASTGACVHILNRHSDMVYSLAWQPDIGDYLATGSNDNKMCITRIAKNSSASGKAGEATAIKQYELLHEYTHPGAVYEISWHPSRNQMAVCGKHETVSVVNFDLP